VNVAIGTKTIGVDVYMPAESPFYRGASYCAQCHAGGGGGDQHTTWVNTPHASAWETLNAIGQGGPGSSCNGCHTVGIYGVNADPDTPIDNGGYDETAVAPPGGAVRELHRCRE
jgi:hypothetical protein